MLKEELVYWYWLSDVKGVGPTITKRLVAKFGSPRNVFATTGPEILVALPIRKSLVENIVLAKQGIDKYKRLAEKQVNLAEVVRGQILTGADPPYSEVYTNRPDDAALPPVVHMLGNPGCLKGRKFAIVGTRNPSDAARKNAFNLAVNLARESIVIVSGLALGVDAESHRGALEAGGDTIAVLGCGPDVVYPSGNGDLYQRIIEKGLILSEFAFGTRPSAENLRQRNRTIVALAEAMTVAECSTKSGAMIAARFAAQQRKPIFTFSYPGQKGNDGCEWLVLKSLAAVLPDTASDTALSALQKTLPSQSASVDKIFRELWPKSDKPKAVVKKDGKSSLPFKEPLKVTVHEEAGLSETTGVQASLPFTHTAPGQKPGKTPPIEVGSNVHHPAFGKGIVTKVVALENDCQVTIRFSKKDTRTFSWLLAKLSKV